MQFRIPFSKNDFFNVRDVKELGSMEETIWSLQFSFDSTTNKSSAKIMRRSLINGEVKIGLRVLDSRGRNLLSTNGFLLLNGVREADFTFNGNYWLVNFTGYVLIHYNSMSSLKSKVEAVTQTENYMSSIVKETILSTQLAKDLIQILSSTDSFSDATLVCGTSKIQVHRVILSARSPVFAAMFKTQMQEGRDGVVDIVDMEPDVLQAMLRYIYSGRTDHLTNSLKGDLLFPADKYQLKELKLICVEELKASMAVSNVIRALVLGDLHDKSLKAYSVKFICEFKKFSDLEKTKEWKSLTKEHPTLALEVLTTVVKHVVEKLNLLS